MRSHRSRILAAVGGKKEEGIKAGSALMYDMRRFMETEKEEDREERETED